MQGVFRKKCEAQQCNHDLSEMPGAVALRALCVPSPWVRLVLCSPVPALLSCPGHRVHTETRTHGQKGKLNSWGKKERNPGGKGPAGKGKESFLVPQRVQALCHVWCRGCAAE